MSDMMTFPDTVEEFMEMYKMIDTEEVYSNGTEYVPIYRMKQWFEHQRTSNAHPTHECVKPTHEYVDSISRQAAIDESFEIYVDGQKFEVVQVETLMGLPSVEPKEVYCSMASRTCFANGKEVAWCLTCPHISEEDRELVKKAVEGSEPYREDGEA